MGARGSEIITIYRDEVFTLDEAKKLLPVVRKITGFYYDRVNEMIHKLERIDSHKEQYQIVEQQINTLITTWHEKIQKLGASTKGLWLVDFDSGDGYFCWKYPELELNFWHSYHDGFTNRLPIETWNLRKNQNQ